MIENIGPYIYALEKIDYGEVEKIAQVLNDAVADGGRIFVAGNGGSHSIAQHFACDLMKAVGSKYLSCFVHCLTDNVALLTAISNDIGYDSVFSMDTEQGELNEKDVVVAFSVSGTSPNIQTLLKVAYKRSAKCVLITGIGLQHSLSKLSSKYAEAEFLSVSTSWPHDSAYHYYITESTFSVLAHEIARLFHIKRGNYRA